MNSRCARLLCSCMHFYIVTRYYSILPHHESFNHSLSPVCGQLFQWKEVCLTGAQASGLGHKSAGRYLASAPFACCRTYSIVGRPISNMADTGLPLAIIQPFGEGGGAGIQSGVFQILSLVQVQWLLNPSFTSTCSKDLFATQWATTYSWCQSSPRTVVSTLLEQRLWKSCQVKRSSTS